MSGLNRVERWLVKLAYPEIDFSTVKFYAVQSRINGIQLVDGSFRELNKFIWQRTYEADHATYVHYASFWFHYDKETNVLFYREGSLKTGREIIKFDLAQYLIDKKAQRV